MLEINIKEAIEALANMYEQYCCEDGHLFMSAGESAAKVLAKYGFGVFDKAGCGTINWEKINSLNE